MSIFKLIFNILFHFVKGDDLEDIIQDALYCYQSVTDTSFHVAFDFNLVYPNPPLLLTMQLEYYSLASALDNFPLRTRQEFTLKLIDKSCENTLEIYDEMSPTKYILLRIKVYIARPSPPLMSFKFIINPQSNSKIMTIRDYHNIAEIYIDFKRNHPEMIQMHTGESFFLTHDYYDINLFNNKCMCGAKTNRKFLIRPMVNGELYKFTQPYNLIIFELQLIKKNSRSEIFSEWIPIWPCECINTRLLYDINIVIQDFPINSHLYIHIKFSNGRHMLITPTLSKSQSSETPKDQLYFPNIKIEKFYQTLLRKNDLSAIYLFKTLKELQYCTDQEKIDIIKSGSIILDFQITDSETLEDSSLTRWYTYMDSKKDYC